jgi:hypothetical protein
MAMPNLTFITDDAGSSAYRSLVLRAVIKVLPLDARRVCTVAERIDGGTNHDLSSINFMT